MHDSLRLCLRCFSGFASEARFVASIIICFTCFFLSGWLVFTDVVANFARIGLVGIFAFLSLRFEILWRIRHDIFLSIISLLHNANSIIL